MMPDATWNPVRGCTRVSEGCRNCYAEAVAARFSGPGMPYEGLANRTAKGPRWTGRIAVASDAVMTQPLRWRKPRRIFVIFDGHPVNHPEATHWCEAVFPPFPSSEGGE